MKTALQQLLANIPDAVEIKQFIFENDADEKMLDEWLFERIYQGKDWEKLEKEQIIDAYSLGSEDIYSYKTGGEKYYKETFTMLSQTNNICKV